MLILSEQSFVWVMERSMEGLSLMEEGDDLTLNMEGNRPVVEGM